MFKPPVFELTRGSFHCDGEISCIIPYCSSLKWNIFRFLAAKGVYEHPARYTSGTVHSLMYFLKGHGQLKVTAFSVIFFTQMNKKYYGAVLVGGGGNTMFSFTIFSIGFVPKWSAKTNWSRKLRKCAFASWDVGL